MKILKTTALLIFVLFASSVYAEDLPVFFDPGIDTYSLETQQSTVMLLKNIPMKSASGFDTYEFNLGDDHLIQFIVHPGSLKSEISEISIICGQIKDQAQKYPGRAVTTKGISLGISKAELIGKIGEPMLVIGDRYEYRSEYHPGIQKKYNMPLYYGKYTFMNDKLISFSFGFEYP
ncbi:MAG: hypothetical protein HKM93_18785 [Desulfobacteraceae bacterium]|nr:hypothetical protein [Desulfobacteraceae bacterium]